MPRDAEAELVRACMRFPRDIVGARAGSMLKLVDAPPMTLKLLETKYSAPAAVFQAGCSGTE